MSGKDKKLKVELKNYSHQAPVSEAKLPEGSVERMAPPQAPKLPPELEAKLKDIKDKLDKFKTKLLEKFEGYIVGIALLPPERPHPQKEGEQTAVEGSKGGEKKADKKEEKEEDKKINVLVLVDDTDSKKMTKDELYNKISTIVGEMAKETDARLNPQTVLLTDIWQSCFDGKSDMLRLIATGAPVHDLGMLGAIKIAEIHKTMVLQKFEKYIAAYVLMGSVPRGKATTTSDIDVWIIIDDTDVKKMTRAELKDKLRAIIASMALEAGDMTGIKNKLSCQVHILTDVWESLKEANPIVFTFLRDGVPFFDRGMFMPWKLMLKMGRIKPSKEAIDMFMNSGTQMIERVKFRLKDIGMEDLFYAVLTPSQAALMLYGIPPTTPRETPEKMREVFVKQEGLLEDEFVKILERTVAVHKDIEHGIKKELTGKEIDELLHDAEKYLKRIDRLFKQVGKKKEEESIVRLYEDVVTVIRDTLRLEGVEKVSEERLVELFEKELVHGGKVPTHHLRDLNEIVEAKKLFDKGKMTDTDLDKARRGSRELIQYLVEHMQRKRGRELERAKVRVKFGNKFGEVILMEKHAFIIHDLDAKEQQVSHAEILSNGSLGNLKESSFEELEKELAKAKFPSKVFIKEPVFERLKEIFGHDMEVLVTGY